MTARAKSDRTFKTTLLSWFKGSDSRATQREIAGLLENPMERRIFEGLPIPMATTLQERVCWIQSELAPKPHFLFVPRVIPYSVEAAYEQAKVEADVAYSPHTAFLNLSSEKEWAAIDFVNEFGPLDLLDEQQPRLRLEKEEMIEIDVEEDSVKVRHVWVDINDFWEKHRRFVAIAKLWELRGDYEGLVLALSKLASLKVHPPVGVWRHGQNYSIANGLPWRVGEFGQWLRKANRERVASAAAEIIKRELDLHCYGMKSQWVCADPQRFQFRIVPSAASLWEAIWHLFARDTTEGLGWRVCPHCSKLFYPKRKDSYFCESKYQKLYSASRWWEQHKQAELANRRKKRAEKTKNDNAKNEPRVSQT
jgi:hypothetical protein